MRTRIIVGVKAAGA